MSHTDIYKNTNSRSVAITPKKSSHRRRRRKSARAFDEKNRSKNNRRSNNSGFRRFRHVWKKPEVQKKVTTIFTVFIVIYIIFIAIWEFWYQDFKAKKEIEAKNRERMQRIEQTVEYNQQPD